MSEMVTKLAQLLEKEGHSAHLPALTSLIQPAARVVATKVAPRPVDYREGEDEVISADKVAAMQVALDALPVGASRFGGVPDLPPGADWPVRDGVPMEFIAQLRLADVAGLDLQQRLPAAGSLLFFYNSQWASSDMEPDEACCAVLFHDGPDEQLVRATPARVEWKSEYADTPQIAPWIHGMATLSFKAMSSLPGGVSPFIDEDLEEFWQDFEVDHYEELYEPLGDYVDNQLLGYVGAQDYVDAHANGAEDQLLLQVDSDDAADFQFGDCDRLYFLLTKAELAARDFSNARVYSILG